jgi:hypothetical protein
MSGQLIHVFLGDTPTHLDDAQAEGEPQLLWKVVLRTGTWKLRPGPGGVKLKAPLKIFRDKAPKGHISLAELKKNFEGDDKGPAKEHVTVPMVHADGTTSDGGFVKKLVIQDVAGEDGSGVKESLLWAGLEITDSDLKKKLDEKSIRGVSGGILFDYERTEDAKKFSQILSHVMVTNSPWINGTGEFKDKLPEGVMASEPDDLPIGEVEFQSRVTDEDPMLPVVQLADPPADVPPEPGKATSKVVWKPEQGLRYAETKIRKALDAWRREVMATIPAEKRYLTDWPYFSVSDVSLEGEVGTALITSGYGSDADTWVTGFKFDSDREVELDPFLKWEPAKQEWVAASEQPTPPPVRPAGRAKISSPDATRTSSTAGLGLREAQAVRAERMRLGGTHITTGGSMGRISDLLSRADLQLSDEDREVLLAEERRLAGLEESESQRRERERKAEVTAYCGSPDGQTEGLLDKLKLNDPGVKKYVRNVLLSDDGGPAIELSEHLADGQKTTGVPKTAAEILKGFIEILPKDKEGRVSLSEQARRLPDDLKPPEENKPTPEDPKAAADALLAEFDEQGLGGDLIVSKGA